MNNTEVIRLRLDASCFDSLIESSLLHGTGQFVRNRDCPMYRAFKLTNVNLEYMGSVRYKLFGERDTHFTTPSDSCAHEVERCRLELLGGANEAFIEMTIIDTI